MKRTLALVRGGTLVVALFAGGLHDLAAAVRETLSLDGERGFADSVAVDAMPTDRVRALMARACRSPDVMVSPLP